MWSTFLGVEITPEQVCWMMVLLKASREVHRSTRDNRIDAVGYLGNLDMIEERRLAQAAMPLDQYDDESSKRER
jgi:hypothetical protein